MIQRPSSLNIVIGYRLKLRHTVFPLGSRHRLEQTRTPRQDFLRMLTLWLLVFLMAQPLE